MTTKEKTAITPTRAEDYPEWYQQVIKAADMAENSAVRGCMVIKPWGYGVWEKIQSQLDGMIKETGHENAYFPLFIPLSFLQKEADHVEGFAKECAIVTHHRLETKDGKLVPAGELEEPLIVRPTSETIIGESFSRWVESYRDLPLLINQWANVVRWEMRTRLFLRTAEFLWQEGHTAHSNAVEAKEETMRMLEVYRVLLEDILAVPVILGEKSPGERFPGAENTYTLEAMMQDGKSLQAGTSHYLGQNFSKAPNISFCNQEGVQEFAYTTSWGMTTRLIGAMVMCHSDDDGLRLPPKVAPKLAVILPFIPKPEAKEAVEAYAETVRKAIGALKYNGQPVSAKTDLRDLRGGEKSWDWIKKGIPVRIEVGPRELEAGTVALMRRDRPHKEKLILTLDELSERLPHILQEIQDSYFKQAFEFRQNRLHMKIETFDQFKAYFSDNSAEALGFVKAKWCGDPETEKLLDDLKVSIRCLPLDQSGTEGKCVITGKPATIDAIFAKSY